MQEGLGVTQQMQPTKAAQAVAGQHLPRVMAWLERLHQGMHSALAVRPALTVMPLGVLGTAKQVQAMYLAAAGQPAETLLTRLILAAMVAILAEEAAVEARAPTRLAHSAATAVADRFVLRTRHLLMSF